MLGEDEAPQGDEEIDVSVSFTRVEPPPPGTEVDATIDGETLTGGELEGGESAYHELFVPAGTTVRVSVVADQDGEDLDVFVEGESFTDSGDEEFVLEGPIDAELEVYLYSDGPTGYIVELSPG
jgi:hypothetical protein